MTAEAVRTACPYCGVGGGVLATPRSDGSVASPRVVAATKPGLFDQAALAAASRWRFQAGAAPTEATRQLRFRLADAESQASSP